MIPIMLNTDGQTESGIEIYIELKKAKKECSDILLNEAVKVMQKAMIEATDPKIEIIHGRHTLYGKRYTWQNPKGINIQEGDVILCETEIGEMPVIVNEIEKIPQSRAKKYKEVIGTFRRK